MLISELIQCFLCNLYSCICPSATDRPDAVQLASEMSDIILRHMDSLQSSQVTLERKLDRERRKTQK